jgi:hypothetical protein
MIGPSASDTPEASSLFLEFSALLTPGRAREGLGEVPRPSIGRAFLSPIHSPDPCIHEVLEISCRRIR